MAGLPARFFARHTIRIHFNDGATHMFRQACLVSSVCACVLASLGQVEAAEGPLRERLKAQRGQQAAAVINGETAQPITRPGDYRFSISHDGLTRRYRVHVPASYKADTPTALLFALHGGGGNMDHMADNANYGQIDSSERHGHIVVFPNGSSRLDNGKLATWNAGNCCGRARDGKVDDIGFIRQVLSNLKAQMNIDASSVYATGMSNGGLMSYRLACEMSDVFAAIAPVAGTDNTIDCTPDRPVSVLHIHARNDERVLFEGGAGAQGALLSQVTNFASVPATIEKWRKRNGCPAMPQRVLDKANAYCERYAPCREGSEVQLCVTASGGHSWPGGSKARAREAPSQAISANEMMWAFFKRH